MNTGKRIARHTSFLCLFASLVSIASSAQAADCVGEIRIITLRSGERVAICEPYLLPFEFCATCPDPFVNVLFDPVDPSSIYVASNPNGIYKSVNGGADWSAMNDGLPDRRVSALAIDPNDSNTLHLGPGWNSLHELRWVDQLGPP